MERGDDLLGLDVASPSSQKKWQDMTFEERQMTESQRRMEAQGKDRRAKIEAAEAEAKAKDIAADTLDELKGQLQRKYGNLLRAWNLGLDTTGDGKLGFTEFCQAVRGQGYAGDLKKLLRSSTRTARASSPSPSSTKASPRSWTVSTPVSRTSTKARS